MRCPACQRENPPQAKFCNACGGRLELHCAGCGQANAPDSRFCNACGHRLDAGAAVRTDRFSSPERYTPKHLADRIINSKAAVEGERKLVTVLFADMKGSTELLADRDPEDARTLLDPVLEHMIEAVHRFEGTVNQVMGDGIMALFGAPLAHEDHAVRACCAALRMQESVKRYADRVRREHGVPIRIRVGLNSGEVVVRAIGSDLHMDYTAVGQTTHLAARMEQLAAPGSTLLGPDTLALAEGFVHVASLGPVAVKGLSTPVEIYELTAISAVRSRLQAAAARGLSKFVGRDVEIEQLRRALEQAGTGRGQIVAVVGEPGVGKSRLAFELTHSHRVEGWLLLEAGSASYGKATSYLPVIDLLKAYFRIGDRDTPRDIREKVTGKVLALDRALEAVLPALLALLDVLGDDSPWRALDPSQRRQRTLDAVKRLLLREAQVQPLLLLFEDLHWIDSETQAVLDSLVESLPPARLLLLVNYRPEYEHRWGSKASYTQIRLDPLVPESARELLHHVLGDDVTIEPLKPILIARTEGNPFFLEESVRALAETHTLVGGRGAYRLAKALIDVHVPATVQAILAARIDRLSPEEKHLLQLAAVVGKDVPFPLLAAIADQPEDETRRTLGRLQAAEFLYEATLFPDLEYTFTHALTHEVAYAAILREQRRATDARIVEVAETLYGDRLTEHVERLASHALRGEEWAKAERYATEAGQKAASRRAHREAVTWFERALSALERLPDRPEQQARVVDLRLHIRDSLLALGDFAGIPVHLRQAERIADALGDLGRQSAVAVAFAHWLWATNEFQQGRAVGLLALDRATRAGDRIRRRGACFVLGEIHHALGDYEQAIVYFVQNIDQEAGDETMRRRLSGAAIPAVVNRRWLAMSLAEVGRFAEGITFATEAVALSEAMDQPYSLLNALVGLGFALTKQGEFVRAIPVLERAREVSNGLGVRLWQANAIALATAYGLTGRSVEATQLLADPQITPHAHTGSPAESWLLSGDLDEAGRMAERELEIARAQNLRAQEASALHVLGEIARSREPGNMDESESHLSRALVLAEALGMRPLTAHCHAGLAKLYRQTGRRAQWHEHVVTATAMYRDMGMTYWLERTQAELAAQ
jgi:class 3 adenylate cyclase/tetratricopeptide (TPR) repeat protein